MPRWSASAGTVTDALNAATAKAYRLVDGAAMSERWARAMLAAYRFAGAAAYPLVGGYVAWRASRGKEDRGRRRERYGIASRPRPPGPLIWVHAASVGETIAVVPLIESILGYGINVVLTTGTVTSARVAESGSATASSTNMCRST